MKNDDSINVFLFFVSKLIKIFYKNDLSYLKLNYKYYILKEQWNN